MGRIFQTFFWEYYNPTEEPHLPPQSKSVTIYICKKCTFQLTTSDHLLSKAFRGHYGTAYLVERVINVEEGEPTERVLMTGRHRVMDIECRGCGTVVGWKYAFAYESDQKYKEGKYVVERSLLIVDSIPAHSQHFGTEFQSSDVDSFYQNETESSPSTGQSSEMYSDDE